MKLLDETVLNSPIVLIDILRDYLTVSGRERENSPFNRCEVRQMYVDHIRLCSISLIELPHLLHR